MRHAALVLAMLAAGCGGAGDGRYRLEILRRAPNGQYVDARSGDDLDVLVGFQGYQFAKMKARLRGAGPDSLALDLLLSIDGMPDCGEDLRLIMVPPAGDPRLSEAFYVYFNHVMPLDEIIGRHARLAFAPPDGAADAVAVDVTLTNRPGCIEQFDGSIKCGSPIRTAGARLPVKAASTEAPRCGQ